MGQECRHSMTGDGSGPHRLQSGVSGVGTSSSPHSCGQDPEPSTLGGCPASSRPAGIALGYSCGDFGGPVWDPDILPQRQSIPSCHLQCRVRSPCDQQDSQGCRGSHLQTTSSGRQAAVQRPAILASQRGQVSGLACALVKTLHQRNLLPTLFQPHGCPARQVPQSSHPAGGQHLSSILMPVGALSDKLEADGRQAGDQGHSL